LTEIGTQAPAFFGSLQLTFLSWRSQTDVATSLPAQLLRHTILPRNALSYPVLTGTGMKQIGAE
jgi:hypothetical protein